MEARPFHSTKFDTLQECFESYVSPEPNSGCHLWMGPVFKQRGGYGTFSAAKFGLYMTRAHRMAWKIYRCDPGEQHVLHTCDNVLCVNPDHLFLGDQAANMRDKALKGRQRHGKSHPRYTHGRYVGDKQNPEYHKKGRQIT
jgi:hypothetical protein